MTPARLAAIKAILEAKARDHPELRAPLRMPGLRRVLSREHVRLAVRPHGRVAQLLPLPGGWTIVIDENVPFAHRVVCGAHELSHLWLHHDPFFARTETSVYDRSPPWYDAVREEEADVIAELLVHGPVTAPLASASAPENKRRTRRAKQLELADPDGEAFLAMVKRAPRDPLPPPDPSSLVQFTVPRNVWSAVRLDAVRQRAGHATYRDDIISMPDHQLVTCTENVAIAIVEELSRAGHKRTAVRVRHAIRQTRQARERTK